MKKILLSILCVFFVSLSFAQNGKNLKTNSAKTVDFLAKELRLDAKQKAIVMNAYGEYTNNLRKIQTKMKKRPAGKVEEKKYLASKKNINESVLRFSEKRDRMVYDCLKKKQSKTYKQLLTRINPMTLMLEDSKKK